MCANVAVKRLALLLCLSSSLIANQITGWTKPTAYDIDIIRIATRLDTNRNRILEDTEIPAAVSLWVTGQQVPGTDQSILDDVLDQLVWWWVSGETMPVCGSA